MKTCKVNYLIDKDHSIKNFEQVGHLEKTSKKFFTPGKPSVVAEFSRWAKSNTDINVSRTDDSHCDIFFKGAGKASCFVDTADFKLKIR